jgi:putative transposase
VLVQALGMQGISKSQVSRLCQELGDEVEKFRCRPLGSEYPYLWMDATFLKVRQDGRVVSQAVVIAIGVKASGERAVLGWDVGPSEDGAFWLQFLRGLKARGLGGVQLVVSDAHQGLKDAIATVLAGTAWQRCRVHFVRNVLALVPKKAAEMVAATIRTVFMQPDAQSTREQWRNHPQVDSLCQAPTGNEYCCLLGECQFRRWSGGCRALVGREGRGGRRSPRGSGP